MTMTEAPRSALANRALDATPQRVLTFYDLPLTLDTTVRITGPFPLTTEEFERLQLLLYVMAPGLTSDPTSERAPEPS